MNVAPYKINDEMEPNIFYDLEVHLVVIAANLELCSTLLVIKYIKFFKRVTSMVKQDIHVLWSYPEIQTCCRAFGSCTIIACFDDLDRSRHWLKPDCLTC